MTLARQASQEVYEDEPLYDRRLLSSCPRIVDEKHRVPFTKPDGSAIPFDELSPEQQAIRSAWGMRYAKMWGVSSYSGHRYDPNCGASVWTYEWRDSTKDQWKPIEVPPPPAFEFYEPLTSKL